MEQNCLLTIDKNTAQATTGGTSRLFFIDHLRAALVILVVLHHVAVVYGAVAPFYYVEPPTNDPLAILVLVAFALFNQAWFMGALFLLSGYFTPGSFDHKGSGAFLKGRLLRLGAPLIVFYYVLNPIAATGHWQMPPSLTGISTPLTWKVYPFLLGMGPMWFVVMLLVFDFGYAAWRRLTGNRAAASTSDESHLNPSTPGYLGIGVFVLALALASYLVRIVVPMGKDVLGFPTLAYFAQYLSFFGLGVAAYRHDWLRALPRSKGMVGFVTAAVATVILFPLALSGRLFSLEIASTVGFVGHGTWESAVYALWDSVFAVGIFLAALTFFRSFFNAENRLGKFLSQHSYAVYIIHIPIVVYIAIALKGIRLENLVKFGLVAVLAVPTCFAAAYVIRKIPAVARIV